MHDDELSVWRNLMEDGTQCLGEEQYLNAEKYFSQGLLKAYELEVPEIVAFTLRLLATVSVRLGNLEFAEDGFKEALRICQELQNAKGMAEAWAGLASVAVKRGMLREAGRTYERAITVYPISSPQLRLGMLYADLGQVYATLESWNRSNRAYTQARQICRFNDFPKGEAELEVLLGELCFQQGKKAEASNYLKQASQIFAQLEDVVSLSNTLQYLALIHFENNQMQLAVECQQRAVALCSKFDSKDIFSESCYFLSKIEQFLENYEEAKYYLDLSIRFYPDQDIDLALRYQSLAGLFFLSMDIAKAEHYYLKALSLFETIDDARIGEIHEALAAVKEIRERKVVPVNVKDISEDKIQLHGEFALEALVRLAELYEKQRNFRDALDCYWKALEMGRDAKLTTDWIEVRVQQVSKRLRGKKSSR
ncbi:MAG TPA: tetratricopeptide repeat protein [Desulfosporosinus sp.]|nr:tetratricopeptide repeat protein [Desulfosporosinus sp.]